jgi:hypothetical protein
MGGPAVKKTVRILEAYVLNCGLWAMRPGQGIHEIIFVFILKLQEKLGY